MPARYRYDTAEVREAIAYCRGCLSSGRSVKARSVADLVDLLESVVNALDEVQNEADRCTSSS